MSKYFMIQSDLTKQGVEVSLPRNSTVLELGSDVVAIPFNKETLLSIFDKAFWPKFEDICKQFPDKDVEQSHEYYKQMIIPAMQDVLCAMETFKKDDDAYIELKRNVVEVIEKLISLGILAIGEVHYKELVKEKGISKANAIMKEARDWMNEQSKSEAV